jgi:CubicO group peptidase (beta-lactamase class C family)
VLRDGVWNGKTLIRKDLLAELFRSSPTNPAYGLTWWLGAPNEAGERGPQIGPALSALPGFKMAAGAGDQRLYVIPSEQLVVVRFGRNSDYDDLAMLEALTGQKLR